MKDQNQKKKFNLKIDTKKGGKEVVRHVLKMVSPKTRNRIESEMKTPKGFKKK
jgi:hypothetical protein